MRVNALALQDFRNYESLNLDFPEQVVIFRGSNAQGKTNLLESLYMLALAKSHRTNRDRDCIRWDQAHALLKADLARRDRKHRVEVQLSPKGKKVKRNGIEQRRLSDYIGTLNAVMFAPEDLAIVKGSPEKRRRFLDLGISQISPVYLHTLSEYYKILVQRNNLLKDLWRRPDMMPLLDVLTEQLVVAGTQVLLKRRHFIHKLEGWARDIQTRITDGSETLAFVFRTFVNTPEDLDEADLQDRYYRVLEEKADQERERRTTLIGPHRDDILFHVNGMNVQTYGSQGQQRTTALSLKLAEIELIFQEIGEYPILLLDDVLSELDRSRQTHLLAFMRDKVQTFVTTTITDGIDNRLLQDAVIYKVENGNVR